MHWQHTSLGASGSETQIEAFELFLVAACHGHWMAIREGRIVWHGVGWCGMVSRVACHVMSHLRGKEPAAKGFALHALPCALIEAKAMCDVSWFLMKVENL